MKAIFLALGVFVWAGNVAAASETRTVDRNLVVTGEVGLDVSSNPGGVTIKAGSVGSVRIHAVIRPLYGTLDLGLAEANIRALEKNPPVEQQGNRIRIGYVSDPAILRAVSIHFDIETPHATSVRAHTTSGGIRIDGIAGPAFADSQSGRIEINDLAADIEVTNSSGAVVIRKAGSRISVRNGSGGIQILGAQGRVDVETTSGRTEISEVHGDVRSRTNSGSIRIDNASGAVVANNHSGSIEVLQLSGPAQAETQSGSIRISQINPAAISARTVTGQIKVDLAGGRGYTIDAKSRSGKVSGPKTTGADRIVTLHRVKGQVGEGGPLVSLDSRSSKIEID
jgi:hypothetical protein